MTPTDTLIVITECSQGPTIVAIEGVLDCLGSAEARKCLDDLIGKGCLDILVDLQDVTGIDSLGIGVFLSAWWQIRNTGGNLVLWRPQGMVQRGLEMLGVADVIEVRGDLG
ncbi:MAG: STAS domain-containing protein [Spirochaetes bacterium]|nr:STAS domain-containing protein [Spirochaetota bacterium]